MVQDNFIIFNNIWFWDWCVLDVVLKQFQEICLYYEFNDVDIDWYCYDDGYWQVMIFVCEMKVFNLLDKSQIFVNEVFKYIYGYGIV